MVDRPIKVDEPTDRLVTDLAYFLRCSKKSVVRDAVAEFAETHHHPQLLAARSGVNGLGEVEAASARAGESADDSFSGSSRGGGLVGARAAGVTFEMLDPLDRLALRRRELLRQFAELGGTNVRVLDEDDGDGASDEASTRIVLLAETDPVDGSAAVPALEEVARRVLGVHTTVVSLTALRLFGSGRLEQALAQSRPL